MSFRALDHSFLVSPQIRPGDVAAAAAAGVTAIVNNRPDGEEPGQPAGADIEIAARSAGLSYHHIPFTGPPAPDEVDRLRAILDGADGTLLAFCKSGTRSTWLWALAERRRGGDPDAILAAAAGAGYDPGPIAQLLGLR